MARDGTKSSWYSRSRSRKRSLSPRKRSRSRARSYRSYSKSRSREIDSVEEQRDPTKVFVKNLQHQTDEIDLEEFFGHYGPIEDIFVPRDNDMLCNRGFGFVTFRDRRDANEACREDGTDLHGRRIIVNIARPRPGKATNLKTYVPSRDGEGGAMRRWVESQRRARDRRQLRVRPRSRSRSWRRRSRSRMRSRSRGRSLSRRRSRSRYGRSISSRREKSNSRSLKQSPSSWRYRSKSRSFKRSPSYT